MTTKLVLICHPDDAFKAREVVKGTDDLTLKVTKNCPHGKMYLMNPAYMYPEFDMDSDEL